MAKKKEKMSEAGVRERAVLAALKLAGEKGWNEIAMDDIAGEAGLKPDEMRRHFLDRFDILSAYGGMIDKQVLDAFPAIEESVPPRDRLFDIMMERFDVLNEQRKGVKAILRDLCADPGQAVTSLPHLGHSMGRMLQAAGINTEGCKGALKIIGLTGIYLKTLRVWKDDNSADMAQTMACLDKALCRAEGMAHTLGLAEGDA